MADPALILPEEAAEQAAQQTTKLVLLQGGGGATEGSIVESAAGAAGATAAAALAFFLVLLYPSSIAPEPVYRPPAAPTKNPVQECTAPTCLHERRMNSSSETRSARN